MNNTSFPIISMEATGLRLKEIFKKNKLRVEDVRDFLGLESTQAIYKWQQGKCFPSVDNLYALSHWLGIPINDMLMGNIELEERANSREREEDRDPLSFFAFLRQGPSQCHWNRPLSYSHRTLYTRIAKKIVGSSP